jgi:hypothetical protein
MAYFEAENVLLSPISETISWNFHKISSCWLAPFQAHSRLILRGKKVSYATWGDTARADESLTEILNFPGNGNTGRPG